MSLFFLTPLAKCEKSAKSMSVKGISKSSLLVYKVHLAHIFSMQNILTISEKPRDYYSQFLILLSVGRRSCIETQRAMYRRFEGCNTNSCHGNGQERSCVE